MNANNNYTEMYEEAINHCRWKKALHGILKDINIIDYNNKTFEEIITEIHNICNNTEGIGMLATYDITSAICRHYKVNIDKVYIIGKGPKRAINLLNVKTKTHKINENIKIRYATVTDIVTALEIVKMGIY